MWRPITRILGLALATALGLGAFLQRDEGDRDVTGRFALASFPFIVLGIALAWAAGRGPAGRGATLAFTAGSVGFALFAREVAIGAWQLRSIYSVWIAFALGAAAFWIVALIRGRRSAD